MPDTVNDRPRPLFVAEVAAELRLHEYTVRNMLVRGDIPGVKLAGRWYVTRENLDKLLAEALSTRRWRRVPPMERAFHPIH